MKLAASFILCFIGPTASYAQKAVEQFSPTAAACAELCQRADRISLEANERVYIQQCALAGLCPQQSRGWTATEPQQKAKVSPH